MNNLKGNGIVVRHLEPRDLTSVLDLIERNWDRDSANLAGKEITSALAGAKPQPVYFVAVMGTTVLGAIGISDSFMDTRIYEIFWVNVHPEWHDSGIGRKLVKQALEYADVHQAHLVILTTKPKTLPFYKKLGFLPVNQNFSQDFVDGDTLMQAQPRQALDFMATRERTVE